MAGLRPIRSPSVPSTIAPIGRVTKPIPKVASDSHRLSEPSVDGKNVLPIYTAKSA
jgi:hypothetical protein